MKKIKKIGILVIALILNIYNICFADLVITPEREDAWNMATRSTPKVAQPKNETETYIIIGILVVIVVICATVIIRRITKNKKEKVKENDDNKQSN